MYKRYYRKGTEGSPAHIVVEVPREGKEPLVRKFGDRPIRHNKRAAVQDKVIRLLPNRSEMIRRLLTDTCELCGAQKELVGHHIRKLKDLKQRYAGRPNPPRWVVRMIELRRKSLMVCEQCHRKIHNGTYDGLKLR